jgi:hypothetical protein
VIGMADKIRRRLVKNASPAAQGVLDKAAGDMRWCAGFNAKM